MGKGPANHPSEVFNAQYCAQKEGSAVWRANETICAVRNSVLASDIAESTECSARYLTGANIQDMKVRQATRKKKVVESCSSRWSSSCAKVPSCRSPWTVLFFLLCFIVLCFFLGFISGLRFSLLACPCLGSDRFGGETKTCQGLFYAEALKAKKIEAKRKPARKEKETAPSSSSLVVFRIWPHL